MRFLVVAGARPNFMKIAPILDSFEQQDGDRACFDVLLVHTGQHYDESMSGVFFRELNIRQPDINLEVGAGSHAEQTGGIMRAFERVCLERRPDCVIVVGDVNSTLACSITAKKLGIAVAHVEAGLRSRDMSMPEEINRLCTDAISDLLFTTDELANENLRNEGVSEERIHFVGNTMIDTLLKHKQRALETPLPANVKAENYAVMTLHRPSNVDNPDQLRRLVAVLEEISARVPVVFPAHPRTKRNLEQFGILSTLSRNVRIIEPLGYLQFTGLVARSRIVLTDSGGIQEETTVLGVPCLTMRNNTERPITCSVGTNTLVGDDPQKIREVAVDVLNGKYRLGTVPFKWDGKAGQRIVNILLSGHSLSANRNT